MSRSASDAPLSAATHRLVLPAGVAVALAVLLGPARVALADGCDTTLLDDSVIQIKTVTDANAKRTALINHLWGQPTLPTGLPNIAPQISVTPASLNNNAALQTELTNLLAQLAPNYGRVDLLQHKMVDANGNIVHTALGWYIAPAANPRGKLVIVHQGHDPTLVDPNVGADGHLGLARTMNNLLLEGYAVIGMYMPGYRPDDRTGSSHTTLVEQTPVAKGSGMQFFMEPVVKFLNYAVSLGIYTNYYMVGLSGGGWTTTVYAAIDPRIDMSFPVAGTVPLFMRSCPSHSGDAEDYFDHGFYGIAGYQDLYILGSYGAIQTGGQRHQTQVLNRNDDCCFNPASYSGPGNWDDTLSTYELAVRNRLYQLGLGMFRLEIDENTTTSSHDGIDHHMVSTGTIFRTILGELNSARRTIGRHQSPSGNSNDAFYRGLGGHLYHRTISPLAEVDTGVVIEGVSESAQPTSTAALNAIARNIHGNPVLVSSTSTGGWTTRTFSGVINNDPTIISGKSGTALWTFGLGADYLPLVWDSSGNPTSIPGPPGLGPISASLRSAGAGFHIFYLGWDRTVRHAYRATTTSTWQTESLGGVTFGYPNGVVDSNGNLVVFQLGTDGLLYWNRKFSGDQHPGNSWTGWTSISNSAGGGAVLTGMPTFFGGSGSWTVLVPLRSGGHLGEFTTTNGGSTWSYSNLGGNFTSPFTTHSTGAFMRDMEMHMWDWTVSAGASFVGGLFD